MSEEILGLISLLLAKKGITNQIVWNEDPRKRRIDYIRMHGEQCSNRVINNETLLIDMEWLFK
jgi:hypothetical protein